MPSHPITMAIPSHPITMAILSHPIKPIIPPHPITMVIPFGYAVTRDNDCMDSSQEGHPRTGKLIIIDLSPLRLSHSVVSATGLLHIHGPGWRRPVNQIVHFSPFMDDPNSRFSPAARCAPSCKRVRVYLSGGGALRNWEEAPHPEKISTDVNAVWEVLQT